jgi:hypothetical protein
MPNNVSPKRRTRTLLLRAVTLGTSAALVGTAACGGSVGTAADAGDDAHMVATGTAPEEAGHPMGLGPADGGGGIQVEDAGLSIDDAGEPSDAAEPSDAGDDVQPVGLVAPDAGSPEDAFSGTIVHPGGGGG